MIPFYKIEPEFLCSRGINLSHEHNFNQIISDLNQEIFYYTCEKEKICENEYDHINKKNLYHSFKFCDYLTLDDNNNLNKNIKLNCHNTEVSFIDYFYLIYFFGVNIGSYLYKKTEKKKTNLKIKLTILITFLSLILIFIISSFYIIIGINTNSIIFILFILNSGLFYYFISTLVIEQYIKIAKFFKSKNSVQEITFTINLFYPISAIINISLFYYYKHWIYNFILFSVISTISFFIFIIIEFSGGGNKINNYEENNNSDIDKNESLIMKTISSTEKFKRVSSDPFSLKSKKLCIPTPKNTSTSLFAHKSYKKNEKIKTFLQKFHFDKIIKIITPSKYAYILNLFLFLITQLNYQILNSSLDRFSYTPFKNDTDTIFIIGIGIYAAEIISIISFNYISYFLRHFYLDLLCIFISGISLTFLQISLLNGYPTILIVFSILQKMSCMYLNLFLQIKIEKTNDTTLLKHQHVLSVISHLGVVLNFFVTNCIQYTFLLIACLYYISFLLILKIMI